MLNAPDKISSLKWSLAISYVAEMLNSARRVICKVRFTRHICHDTEVIPDCYFQMPIVGEKDSHYIVLGLGYTQQGFQPTTSGMETSIFF